MKCILKYGKWTRRNKGHIFVCSPSGFILISYSPQVCVPETRASSFPEPVQNSSIIPKHTTNHLNIYFMYQLNRQKGKNRDHFMLYKYSYSLSLLLDKNKVTVLDLIYRASDASNPNVSQNKNFLTSWPL